jgi:hypothetical protein
MSQKGRIRPSDSATASGCLGGLQPVIMPEASAKGARGRVEAADRFARNVMPIVRQIQAGGAVTTRAIAAALNARGVRTVRGGAWHAQTVANLLAR